MRARVVVVCLVAALVACGPRGVGKQPSWRAPQEPTADAGANGSSTVLVVEPAAAGARAYNERTTAAPRHTDLSRAIVGAVQEAAAAAGRAAPVDDARLFEVAAELAPIAREDAPIPYSLVEFALRHHGIVEPTPHIILIWGPLDRGEVIADKLRARLPSVLENTRIARVGVGSVDRGSTGVILLILQPSFLETEPIPRRVAADGAVALRARVLAPYGEPEVFVTHEDGTVSQPPVTTGAGGALSAEISCRGRRGAQQVEITAVDRNGSAVLANFPVWCAVEPPTSARVTAAAAGNEPIEDLAEAEASMVELVNRDREVAGLPPLVAHAGLAAVARAHSEEMRATGNVAHVSPTTGSAADRVRAAGIRTAMVLENVARAYGVAEAQEGLMNSPGHRANILAREATHVGVGMALGASVADHREVFVTQVFMRVPPQIDSVDAARELRTKVERHGSLAHDPDLAAIAGVVADAIARGASTEQAAKQQGRKLDALSERYQRVTTIVNPVADADAFPVDVIWKDAAMTHFGIGVAQGPHDVIGERAIYVVVLVGERRK